MSWRSSAPSEPQTGHVMMRGSATVCVIAASVLFFVRTIDLPVYRRMARSIESGPHVAYHVGDAARRLCPPPDSRHGGTNIALTDQICSGHGVGSRLAFRVGGALPWF